MRITLYTFTASHLHCTAGSSRSFTAYRKDAGLYCGSRLLEGRSVCLCWAKSKPKGPKVRCSKFVGPRPSIPASPKRGRGACRFDAAPPQKTWVCGPRMPCKQGTRSTRSIRNQARARLAPDLRCSACTIKARAQLALGLMKKGHETVLDNFF